MHTTLPSPTGAEANRVCKRVGMLTVRRPSASQLRAVADRARSQQVTYRPVGATVTGDLPRGFRHDDLRVVLGRGPTTFERARSALRAWAPHRGAGLTVSAGAEVAADAVVALSAPVAVGWVVAACRIVAVIDEDARYGFAYGTLDQHPESGEMISAVADAESA